MKHEIRESRLRRRLISSLLGCGWALTVGYTAQAQVTISQTPLFLAPSVPPNVVYILDDSRSMLQAFLPDELSDEQNTKRVKSPYYNKLYYNPAVTYVPPLDHEGNPRPNSSFTSAWVDGYDPGTTVNLSTNYRVSWNENNGSLPSGSGEAAYYYEYVPGNSGCNKTPTDEDCYTKRSIPMSQRTNFANWYSYYRTRLMVAKAASSRAFATLGSDARVGYSTINLIDDSSLTVREFSDTRRENFYEWLFELDADMRTGGGYTPLRKALDEAGQFFTTEQPYRVNPASSGSSLLTCRANYTILMSDGYWNSQQAGTSAARSNNDGTAGPSTITGPNGESYTFDNRSPFADTYSNSLADVAMYYWKTDLRPTMTNNVPVTPQNPAFWQHMVTFGVGLGVPTAVDPDEAFAALTSGLPNIVWPDPDSNYTNDTRVFNLPAGRADDLLHAAVNGRGGFFNAQDPEEFTSRLSNVLADIVTRTESSSTSAATSSAVLQSDTYLYTAGFRSTDWSGMFTARAINSADGSVGAVVWDAEARLRAVSPAARTILTVDSSSGETVELDYDNLSTAQQDALDHNASNVDDGLGPDRVDWLRGDDTANAAFRSRASSSGIRRLGDIVHSNPRFVANTDYGYSLLSGEGSSYRSFRSSIASRPGVIYVGANDGMLHAFHAATGDELFAYMPSELLLPESGRNHAPVSRLTDPDYEHRFMLDGTAAVSDAYIDGAWRTVLVGTMGAGGRTVFALDITDPATPEVLWEFSHADLGYNVGEPSITRMRNGDWAAVFGNGYNGSATEAVLFVVRLSDGALLKRLGTGNAGGANGLAAAVVTDWPRADLMASHIFAGDLQGNLWHFDVSSDETSSWTAQAAPLFTATDSGGNRQPITARPAVAVHPDAAQPLVVTFGTGSYFRTTDASDSQVQSLYGIFYSVGETGGITRNDLQSQEIESQESETFNTPGGPVTYQLRTISSNELDELDKGWYLDLDVTSLERVISAPTFPSSVSQSRVRFSTLIPDFSDPCNSSRRGFLMDIDLRTGGRYSTTVFDLNLDDEFDDDDWIDGEVPSGVGFGAGELPTVVRQPEISREILYSGDGEETVFGLAERFSGRQSWRQLR